MAIGFDFGTSNCSVAQYLKGELTDIPLTEEGYYIPSTISAPNPESISEYLFRLRNIKPSGAVGESLLRRAMAVNQQEGLLIGPDDIQFGQSALKLYLDDPKHIYYVKSPKSFLGTIGLRDAQIAFFEDLVCAMMGNIKTKTETALKHTVTDVVIGRPVNFHGRGGERSNRQAEAILRRAAVRVGFKNIEFQFEPVAAGLAYESTLNDDKTVLVVDIGGGTSDCSMIKMGPSWQGQQTREASLLAHTGVRIGGNDLDIALAYKQFMAHFGLGSSQISGLPMPNIQFWNAVAINDVVAQHDFYKPENRKALEELVKAAEQPEKLVRLLGTYQSTLGHSIVREAENTKIALSDSPTYRASLSLLEASLELEISDAEMREAATEPMNKITRVIEEAISSAGVKPDVVYMTGGSARSPMLREAVASTLGHIDIVTGSYFGSVTSGLARWADTCFR